MNRTIAAFCAGVLIALGISVSRPYAIQSAGQAVSPAQPGADAAQCEALLIADSGSLPDAPTRVTSARLVDVPAADPKLPPPPPPPLLAGRPTQQKLQGPS